MNQNTNPLLLAIAHQLEVANLISLEQAKATTTDKSVIHRIAKYMDKGKKLQKQLQKIEVAQREDEAHAEWRKNQYHGMGPNAARRAAGMPTADSGTAFQLDPGIYGRNLRAFTLETLHTEVDQLRRQADNFQAREALHAVQNILDRHINANIAEGKNAAAKTPPPVPARESYRDPDLSEKWLKQAEHRATHDDSKMFRDHDCRRIIRRLVAEVRRLNTMLNR